MIGYPVYGGIFGRKERGQFQKVAAETRAALKAQDQEALRKMKGAVKTLVTLGGRIGPRRSNSR